MSGAKPIAAIIPWSQVCRMLDKVQTAVKASKKEMLVKFIVQFRDLLKKKLEQDPQCTDSFFPILRILLPALDRARGAYGVKERKLAELYIRILGLKKEGNDAQKLLHFRKPKSEGGGETGDFAEVAYYVLRSRCDDKGNMTLLDVDTQLTSIAENYAAKKHEDVERSLLTMLRKMTATEQKWLIRVLLKDMKLGIGQGTIFNAWHPDAKDYFDVNNSLEKVCKTLRDPTVRLHEIEVSLFSAFRPMLAERAVLEKVETQMDHKTYYAETKFDGERSQIHKKGNAYKYFSRNGFDFTNNFGSDPYSGLFTPYLHGQFLPHVKDIILDGEMVGWSKKHNTIVSKGEQLDVKNLKEDGDWQVCLVVFDIIYLNGQVLTNLPLSERLEKVKTVLTPKEGRVQFSTKVEVTTKEDVVRVLNEAIDNREEGVVLKNPDSIYCPASRKGGWIKVKPEYVDSLVSELDLLIIGAYYGSGRRKGVLSHFLLGVAVSTTEAGGKPTEFHSFCRVGSGYTYAELGDLMAKLSPHVKKGQAPPGVFVTREKPDLWINPAKSCIVQVRAAEIIKSDVYKTGVTLRFPRVEKVRYDKPWYDTLTTKELDSLVKEASGKLATKHLLEAGDEPTPKRKALPKVEQISLPMHFRPADLSQVVKKDELFNGMEMCIMSGDEDYTKQQLERMVVEHGGTLTQHPGKDTHYIITNTRSVRVNSYIGTSTYNVIRPSWVIACTARCRLVPLGPLDAIHVMPEEKARMKELFDKFGDSYYEPTDEKTLKRVMDNMKEEDCTPLSVEEMREFDEVLCGLDDTRALFRPVTAVFVDGEGQELASLALRLHGGSVEESTTGVTHIVVTDKEGSACNLRPSDYKGRHLVTSKWVYECIEKCKLLEERYYMP
ncbi:DNA ligase 4-like [Penaeus japonicus]|uniref:DNA ligase 4-like n=1 Tax=Penaeus japonicus TaxID=27405 RepID=UPI001C710F58|nr:DNA ligase 4-like [Penaeus japonicus]